MEEREKTQKIKRAPIKIIRIDPECLHDGDHNGGNRRRKICRTHRHARRQRWRWPELKRPLHACRCFDWRDSKGTVIAWMRRFWWWCRWPNRRRRRRRRRRQWRRVAKVTAATTEALEWDGEHWVHRKNLILTLTVSSRYHIKIEK